LTVSLNIKDRRTHEAVRRLAELTGESLTEAVRVAVQERLTRLQARSGARPLVDRLNEIALHCANGPIDRSQTDDEILGYDEQGLPN
jgi:antitoxin VapB